MKIRQMLALSVLLLVAYACKKDAPKQELVQKIEVRQWQPTDTRSITGVTEKKGVITKTDHATPGYILFQPSNSSKTFLMDIDGNIVNQWNSELNSMCSYLLENGHLMRLERDLDFPTFAAGGQAGRIREYDWDGNLIWDFKHATEKELIHHDIEILPNGNVLAISYEVKSPEEAIANGMNPAHVAKAGVWPDKIIEIKPIKPSGGEIVWEWHMWDHLIQDFDKSKANYGVISEHPGKININVHVEGGPPITKEQLEQMKKGGLMTSNATVENQGSDITHTNAISYNALMDQIVISVPHYSEIFIIDHKLSTKEAKTDKGDLLYRWGNPMNYGRGSKEDQQLFGQHDVKWIPEGYPGAGNLMVFNNDIANPNNKLPSIWAALMQAKSPDPQVAIGDFGNYSAVDEFSPPTDENGSYFIPETLAIGPKKPSWSYMAPDKYSFYSPFISGSHRMKNGNTMVTSGAKGIFYEVTPENEIVWQYNNPYNYEYKLPDGSVPQPVGPFIFGQFRGTHYTLDYPAFKDKQIKPVSPQPQAFKLPSPKPPVEHEGN